MTAGHVRATAGAAGALAGAIALLVAGCTVAGGDGGQRAGRTEAAQDAVAASPSGPDRAYPARATTGSRIAWAPSLPECANAAGTGATPGRQAGVSPAGSAGPCVRPAHVPAMCPRHSHQQHPCRDSRPVRIGQ